MAPSLGPEANVKTVQVSVFFDDSDVIQIYMKSEHPECRQEIARIMNYHIYILILVAIAHVDLIS